MLAAFSLFSTVIFTQSIELQNLGSTSNLAFSGGFTWQVTNGNLCKHDGSNGDLLQKNPLPQDIQNIYEIASAPDGSIWATLGRNGMGQFKDGAWKTWNAPTEPVFDDSLYFQYLLVRSTGEVWASAYKNNGYRYYHYDGSFWQEEGFLRPFYIRGWAIGPSDELIFCATDTMFLKEAGGAWQPMAEPDESNYNTPELPTFDRNGKLWAVSNNKKFYRYDLGLDQPPTYIFTATAASYNVHCMGFDAQNELYFGSDANGLGHWDGSIVTYSASALGVTTNEFNILLLQFSPIDDLYVLNYVNSINFWTKWANGAPAKNLIEGPLQAEIMGLSRNGDLWFGGGSPYFSRKKESDGSYDHFPLFDLGKYFTYHNNRFVAGKGSEMWLFRDTILHFDGNQWATFQPAQLPPSVNGVAADSKGNLFFYGYWPGNAAVVEFDAASQSWGELSFGQIGIFQPDISAMTIDGADNLYLVNGDDLIRRSPSGNLELFDLPNASPFNFGLVQVKTGPANEVYVLEVNTFSGIENFLYHFDPATTEFTTLPWPDPSFGQQGILTGHFHFSVDALGRVWLGEENNPQIWVYDGDLWVNIPTNPLNSLFSIQPDAIGNVYFGGYAQLGFLGTKGAVEGFVSRDLDQNCSAGMADQPAANFLVKGKNGASEYFTITKNDGSYRLFSGKSTVEVSPVLPNNLWQTCAPATVALTVDPDSAVHQDFMVQPVVYCPRLSVGLSTPRLRRCFDNNFKAKICNDGTQAATAAHVDLILPAEMVFVSASLPSTEISPNVRRFGLGDLEVGACKIINLTLHVNCNNTSIGQTLCVSAQVSPDTICEPPSLWKGATVLLGAACDPDSVRFTLKNTGNAATSTILPFRLIRNLLEEKAGEFTLSAGQTMQITAPRGPETWRLTAAQEPNHPFSPKTPSLAVEGCTSGSMFDRGFVTAFENSDGSDFSFRFCEEIIGSFDPNDKSAAPKGVGDAAHIIAPNTQLDYRIRFQNTGTDTAFTVVVRDTLDEGLDLSTLEIGVSSHPMEVELRDHALAFVFQNILLPDSNINEVDSHGFLTFKIRPRADMPLGTVIKNRASIYFDFNEAVVTNQVWHTIDNLNSVLETKNQPDRPLEPRMSISPNPSSGLFWAKSPIAGMGVFELFDAQGRSVFLKKEDASTSVELKCELCPAGLYWLRFQSVESGRFWFEKLVIGKN